MDIADASGWIEAAAVQPHQDSEITEWDKAALAALLKGRTDLRILEVGSWLGGGSTQILAEHAQLMVCVDHWQGNGTPAHEAVRSTSSPVELFRERTESFADRLVMIVADSVKAAALLPDGYFDFIFIDANHTYFGVLHDIKAFFPKLSPDGIMAGHDCEGRLSDQALTFTSEQLAVDSIASPIDRFLDVHPGVIRAVAEVFGGRAFLFSDDANVFYNDVGAPCFSTIWASPAKGAPRRRWRRRAYPASI